MSDFLLLWSGGGEGVGVRSSEGEGEGVGVSENKDAAAKRALPTLGDHIWRHFSHKVLLNVPY